MPKWKEGETEFSVSVNDDGNGSNTCRIPKPIMDRMNYPKRIKFLLIGKRIEIQVD